MKINQGQMNKEDVQKQCKNILGKMGYDLIEEQCNSTHLHAERKDSFGQSLQLVFSTYNGISKLGVFSGKINEESGILSHDVESEATFIRHFEHKHTEADENGFRLTNDDYVLAIV